MAQRTLDGIQAEFAPRTVSLAELKNHPRNYRTHPDDQIEHLMESIREHGLYRNIVVARDLTILAGHGVVEAARRLELRMVPVVQLDLAPDEPRALKVLAGDNEVMHLGEVDDRALSELLKEIKETDLDGLVGTGYDEMMVANLVMVTRPASEIEDFDEAAHWVGLPEYEPGQETLKVVVSLASEEDRDRLLHVLGVSKRKGTGSTWSVFWPEKDRDDTAAVRFEAS